MSRERVGAGGYFKEGHLRKISPVWERPGHYLQVPWEDAFEAEVT